MIGQEPRKRILIVYHTGAGSTRTICIALKARLSSDFIVDLQSIFEYDKKPLDSFDFLIFGFPTYHCSPSKSMMEFVKNLQPLGVARNGLVLTTYGLYPGNSIRMLIKELSAKRILTIGYSSIRGPASDGVLMLPKWISFMFKYEKSTCSKIRYMEQIVRNAINNGGLIGSKIPSWKWYTPLNYPNNYFGRRIYSKYRKRISVDYKKCIKCGLCISNCGRGCWRDVKDKCHITGESGSVPVYDSEHCEFCMKCIHNCPAKAISFNKRMVERPRLNKIFYENWTNRLLKFLTRDCTDL